MKILVDYDPNTGMLEANNMYAGTMMGLESLEHKGSDSGAAKDLVALKNGGFKLDDIIKLKQNDLI